MSKEELEKLVAQLVKEKQELKTQILKQDSEIANLKTELKTTKPTKTQTVKQTTVRTETSKPPKSNKPKSAKIKSTKAKVPQFKKKDLNTLSKESKKKVTSVIKDLKENRDTKLIARTPAEALYKANMIQGLRQLLGENTREFKTASRKIARMGSRTFKKFGLMYDIALLYQEDDDMKNEVKIDLLEHLKVRTNMQRTYDYDNDERMRFLNGIF